MISDGAELLMLTPYSKLVGSCILPVLGAVPDGAIVLFSGIGSDAQTSLDVGVGAWRPRRRALGSGGEGGGYRYSGSK